jgi:hypothetical protein
VAYEIYKGEEVRHYRTKVPGSEEVSVLVEALESQLELEGIDKAPCCLPQEQLPATYRRLQDFVTCSKKYPGYSAVGCFTIPNSLATSSPYIRKSTALRTGVKVYGGGVYIYHTPGNRALQRIFCAKSRGRLKDTFGKRFQVYRFKGSDRILYEGDRRFYLMRWELIALHTLI